MENKTKKKEQPKKEKKEELNFIRPDEAMVCVGDVAVHGCEGLENSYRYMIALLESKSVQKYLDLLKKEKAMKGSMYG